jgi:hypothetical protein
VVAYHIVLAFPVASFNRLMLLHSDMHVSVESQQTKTNVTMNATHRDIQVSGEPQHTTALWNRSF